MNDHKFTDDEIIKAYELCFTPKGTSYTCAKCPFHKIVLCKIERDRAALDLLHRQKAKIKRLQSTLEREIYNGIKADEEIEHLKAEIEGLKKIGDDKTSEVLRHDAAIRELHKQLETAKAEAIKEFAENVKAIFECVLYFDDDVKECILNEIDELVKEMTEGANNA